MSDPTEFVIKATFCTALGLFGLSAVTRKLLKKKQPAPAPLDSPVFPELESSCPIPPPCPLEQVRHPVPTELYGPLDLIGAGLIFTIFFSLVISSIKASSKADLVLDRNAVLVSITFQWIIAAIVICFVIRRIRPIDWLGLRWPAWRQVFWIAPAAVVSMWGVFGGLQVAGFMHWIESFGVESVQDTVKLLQNSKDPGILGLMTLAAVVVAPCCEEIVFRGYLYPVTQKFAGPWVAGICSALVFAAAHGSLAALLPLFIFGCLLVLIYQKTGSLWAPMAVHFCFNGATVMIQLLARYFHLPLDPSL